MNPLFWTLLSLGIYAIGFYFTVCLLSYYVHRDKTTETNESRIGQVVLGGVFWPVVLTIMFVIWFAQNIFVPIVSNLPHKYFWNLGKKRQCEIECQTEKSIGTEKGINYP